MVELTSISQIIASGVGAAATLVVAVFAMVGIFVNARISKKSELRLAYRKIMEEKYSKIGSAIYQVVAVSNVVINRYESGQDVKDKLKRLEMVKEDIERYRLETRYSLWGLDAAFNLMKKLPSYSSRCNTRIDLGYRTVRCATSLREALDKAIMYSYVHGECPSRRTLKTVARCCSKLSEQYALIDAARQTL